MGLSFTVPLCWEGVSGCVDSSGVGNVTFFTNFLLYSINKALRRVDAASFKAIDSKIHTLSEDAYYSRICMLVESLKM